MKFKAIVFIMLSFLLSNCKPSKDKTREITATVIGNWTNCIREYEDRTTMMGNVCLKISFNKDHSGVTTDGMGDKHKFTWTINADTLNFKNAIDHKYILYEDGQYKITEEHTNKDKKIIFYNISRKVKYYLLR